MAKIEKSDLSTLLIMKYEVNSGYAMTGLKDLVTAFVKILSLSQVFTENLRHMRNCIRKRRTSLGDSSC